jgi:hypothetical protein
MADKIDFEPIEFEPIEEDQVDFEPVDFEPMEEASNDEMGAGEAAITGFGQGASLGLTPIVSGLASAGMEAAEDVGDILGLTTDAELRDQGFDIQDDKAGLQGLLDAYYEGRARQKAQEEKAFEDQPLATMGSNIAGGVATMGGLGNLAQSLSKGGKIAQAASKILPSAEAIKKGGAGAKALSAAKEGAKAGGIAMLGSGESKLAEGEVLDTAKEVAEGAILGAGTGAGLSFGLSGLKKAGGALDWIPGVQSLKTGYKLGREGIALEDKEIRKATKEFSNDLFTKIQKTFKDAGLDRREALDFAEELDIRINAGEDVNDAIDKIYARKYFDTRSAVDRDQFGGFLKGLKGVGEDIKTAQNKLQSKIKRYELANEAKLKQKEIKSQSKAEKQFVLDDEADELQITRRDETPIERDIRRTDAEISGTTINAEGEEVPFSYVKKQAEDMTPANVRAKGANIQKIGDDEFVVALAEDETTGKLISQFQKLAPVDTIDNLNQASLRDVEGLIDSVNRYTGDFTQAPKNSLERTARQLAKNLRDKSNQAIEDALGEAGSTKDLAQIYQAAKRLGVKDKIGVTSRFGKEEVEDQISTMIRSGGDKAQFDKDAFFKYMGEIDPEFAPMEQRAELLKEATDLAKMEDVRTTGIEGLLGAAQSRIGKIGNVAGRAVKGATGSTQKAISQTSKTLYDMAPEEFQQMAARLRQSGKEEYANIAQSLATEEGTRKNASIFMLMQQPWFSDFVEKTNILGEEEESIEREGTQPGITLPVMDLNEE